VAPLAVVGVAADAAAPDDEEGAVVGAAVGADEHATAIAPIPRADRPPRNVLRENVLSTGETSFAVPRAG
jgi:hypothetical protein